MDEFILFSFLVGHQNGFSGLVIHKHCSIFLGAKPLLLDLIEVNQGQGQAIGKHRPELFHQVQGQPRPPRPIPVQKSDRRIKSHGLQGGPDIMHQQGIKKRQQAINPIQRRPPVSFGKGEILLLGKDQVIEDPKIGMGRFPLDAAEHVQGSVSRNI